MTRTSPCRRSSLCASDPQTMGIRSHPDGRAHTNSAYELKGIQCFPESYIYTSVCLLSMMICLFYPGALCHLIRHASDTVDLFYPEALCHLIRPAWDTVDLFYPEALCHLIRPAWDTVDLFYPGALCHLIRHASDTVDLFYPGSLSKFQSCKG